MPPPMAAVAYSAAAYSAVTALPKVVGLAAALAAGTFALRRPSGGAGSGDGGAQAKVAELVGCGRAELGSCRVATV